ncbi:hypothetical protein CA982_18570 [Gordonia lacunae]|uniref:Uncharacterized protein n=1 Tax=Gordonia lacunae TaxID=417102 RepID=A0A243Q6W3_9ACTN|nr:hypothetical protein CA982_18570 [Gordonia lacunae]
MGSGIAQWRSPAVLAAAAAVAVAGLSGCADDPQPQLEIQALDEDTARSTLTESGVVIPPGFRFVAGVNNPTGFPGSPSNYVRYDGPAAVFAEPQPMSDANPAFGAFRDTDCSSPLVVQVHALTKLGLSCTPTTRMQVSQAADEPNDQAVPPGGKALVLVAGSGVSQLYVIVQGT